MRRFSWDAVASGLGYHLVDNPVNTVCVTVGSLDVLLWGQVAENETEAEIKATLASFF